MTNTISYTARISQDKDAIEAFLVGSRTGVLALCDEGSPYAVPVNYVWVDGSVFFHGAGSGRKIDVLLRNPSVCFTVFEEFATVDDPVPCHVDTAYRSVMLFGEATRVTDPEVLAGVLQEFLGKYTPGRHTHPLTPGFVENYRSGVDGQAVGLFRIAVHDLTAKENLG
jgi:nitroimidazol reductase NimA-like FMN-containing flavoprotein (pyridoxamine 5'-phosphate oxidase superfamily)